MGDIQEIIRLDSLSTLEQRIVLEHSSLVSDLFSEKSVNSDNDCDSKTYTPEIKKFLHICITIFSLAPNNSPSCSSPKDENEEGANEIVKQTIAKFRAVYRSAFRGVQYLASGKLEKIHQEASKEAHRLFRSLAAKLGVDKDNNQKLEGVCNSQIAQEREWICILNNARKAKVIDLVKTDILVGFKKEIEEQFPPLFSGSEFEFYDEENLFAKYTLTLSKAKEAFKADIPFPEKEHDMKEMCTEFEKELKMKIIDDLILRNVNNKKNTKSVMTAIVDGSLKDYKDRMCAPMENPTPLQPEGYLDSHKQLGEELVPKFIAGAIGADYGMEELQTEYMNRYHRQLHEAFGEFLNVGRDKALASLQTCHDTSNEKTVGFVNDMQQVFRQFKISEEHSVKLQKRIEEVVTQVIQEIRESSLANKRNIDSLLERCKPTYDLTKAEKVKRESTITAIMKTMQEQYVKQMRSSISSKKHERSKKEISELLLKEFKNKIGDDPPTGKYIDAFQDFADKRWRQVKRDYAAESASTSAESTFQSPQLLPLSHNEFIMRSAMYRQVNATPRFFGDAHGYR